MEEENCENGINFDPKTKEEKAAFERYKKIQIKKITKGIMQRLDKKLTVLVVLLLIALLITFALSQRMVSYECKHERPGQRLHEIFMFRKSPFSWDGLCKIMTKKNGRFLDPKRVDQAACEKRMQFYYDNNAGCKKIELKERK